MTRTELLTQSSPWFILLCLLIGAAYSTLLYTKKPIWGDKINRVLAVLRFLVVSFLCFLILSPIVKQIKNVIEKPILLVAVDNSESLAEVHKGNRLKQIIGEIKKEVNELEADLQIEYLSLNNSEKTNLDSIEFNYPVSNLSAFLSGIQSKYENQNLSQVIFLTDGIFNQGISPDFQPYNFNIFPIALGDTVPKKDFNLRNLLYNKVAFRGNKFPIIAEFSSEGYKGENVKINLSNNGKVLESQNVKLKGAGTEQVTFYSSSGAPGMQHYSISIDALPGEFTDRNNTANAYIDIIDNKEKILLVALAPHPDIKAIKSAIETKENYEFQIFIPGISTPPKESKYDLIIFHQIPDISNSTAGVFNEYKQKSKNYLFILASQSGFNQFNSITESIDIYPRGSQKDEVFPNFNKAFTKFTIEENKLGVLAKMPPILVPFAEYQIPPHYEILLNQKVGNVETNKPLIALGSSENDKKTGIIVGNGIWEWRIQEYSVNKNTELFDEIITKVVQYLSSKEDKRKFKVYPIANEIFENEVMTFETEVYNNIYEKVYGQKINLDVVGEDGKRSSFNYINSQNSSRYEIGGLKPGVYSYSASTNLDGKKEVSTGQFIIKELQLESLDITANHQLLKELANNTEGRVFYPNQIASISDYLNKNTAKGKVHSFEENLELIHLKWIFFIILILISIEWVLRKYNGSF